MNRAKGFSLIEVLVALVLTTIGVLGMVALQSKAVIYTSDAAARDTAVTLVNELIEIMRTHRDQLYKNKPPEQYSYTQLLTSTDIYDQNGKLKVTASCPNNGVAQTLVAQVGCWLQKVENSLPAPEEETGKNNSRIMVCPSFKLNDDGDPDCAGNNYLGSTLAVKITWRGKDDVCGAKQDSFNCSYVSRVEL